MKLPFAFFLLAGSVFAHAASAIVNVGGMQQVFLPLSITINAGDTVTFVNKGGFHNVVADDGSFRCANGCDGDGKGGSGAASSTSWLAKVTFAKVGTFGYFCEIHGQPGAGMYGTITVRGAPSPPPPAPADPIPTASDNALALLIAGIVLCALLSSRTWRR